MGRTSEGPDARANARARLRRLTLGAVLGATVATVVMGRLVATEHPGASTTVLRSEKSVSSQTTGTASGSKARTSTSSTTTTSTSSGAGNGNAKSGTTTTASTTTTSTTAPTTTTTKPVTTSGGTSH